MLAAGLAALLATPATAGSAQPEPHVVDPAGDADGANGLAGAASQPRFDLRAVTLRTTKQGSTFTVTFTMEGPTAVDVAALLLVGDVDTCGELRITAALDPATRRPTASAAWTCDRLPGRPTGVAPLGTPSVRGKTVVVTVRLSKLHPSMRAGARYAKFAATVQPLDPVGETAPLDTARGVRGYALAR